MNDSSEEATSAFGPIGKFALSVQNMSLRDYFASQSLIASMVMASSRGLPPLASDRVVDAIANAAYAVADAMLRERGK